THRPYQQELYNQFADSPYVIWAVGMGGGKSKIIADMHSYHKSRRGLIVCPEKVLNVWPEEFEKHASEEFKVFVARGNKKQKCDIISDSYNYDGNSVLVISYDTVWREPYCSALLK